MRTRLTTAVLIGMFLIATTFTFAQGMKGKDEGNKNRAPRTPLTVENMKNRFANVEWSDEQKEKLRPIAVEFVTKLNAARTAYESVIPKELRDARAAASKKLRATGLTGKQLSKAVDGIVELTESQKAAVDLYRKLRQKMDSEFRTALRDELSAEQRKMVGIPSKNKKGNNTNKNNDKNKSGKGKQNSQKNSSAQKNANKKKDG